MQIVDPTMQILLCRSYMYTVDPTCTSRSYMYCRSYTYTVDPRCRSYMQILHVDPTCTVDPTCRSYMQILHVDPTCTQVPVQWYMYGYGTWVPFLNLVQSHTVPGVPVQLHRFQVPILLYNICSRNSISKVFLKIQGRSTRVDLPSQLLNLVLVLVVGTDHCAISRQRVVASSLLCPLERHATTPHQRPLTLRTILICRSQV